MAHTGGSSQRVVFSVGAGIPSSDSDHVEEFEILFVPPNRWRVVFQSPPGRVRSRQARDRDAWWLDQSPNRTSIDGLPPPITFQFMEFFRASRLLDGLYLPGRSSVARRAEGIVLLRIDAPTEIPAALTIPGADSAVISIRPDRDVIVAVAAQVQETDAYQIEMSELDFDGPIDDAAFRATSP
jgi:hypothetical protein